MLEIGELFHIIGFHNILYNNKVRQIIDTK